MALAGKVVWITGASSGIGAEVAEELARRGAGWWPPRGGADALDALAAARRRASPPRPGDITDHDGIAARRARRSSPSTGRIDIALLNAGTYRPVLPEDFSAELFRPHVEVNIMGTVNCIAGRAARTCAARHGGRIAVVASVTGFAAAADGLGLRRHQGVPHQHVRQPARRPRRRGLGRGGHGRRARAS